MDGFTIHLDRRGPETVISLAGEMDLATADDVRSAGEQAVHDDAVSVVAFDLSQVTFMDSTGLGALLAVRKAGEEVGVKVRVDKASDAVAHVLTLTGLADAFDIITVT